ncbi:MAG: helix-turn-helix transcriptional regulator [Alphaproteobacteria bacterium]|nr:helix-turn-helix transcriptional regulator [Reyranella sp.]MBL6853362.1 helix-turn-helix transcriptional regulator [Alphaproteobacteria bacterium]MBL6940106.1 helix-turn-helix transcriptional regulator [Alphaproteobacteria bacterium]MBL7100193.1 helix-turn-helix transcriptional regulator [Alphaproteobacteria bacterium]
MAQPIYVKLGKNIRARRERVGLTQDKLANLVGLSRTSITNVERGRQQMLVHQLLDFAAALKTNSGELLEGLAAASAAHAEPAQVVPPEVQKLVAELRKAGPKRARP